MTEAGATADALEAEIAEVATTERAEQEKRYLKSDLRHLGATVPAVRKVATAFARDHPDLAHDELVALTEALWGPPVHERRRVAVELLDLYGDRLGASDLPLVERLIRESRTWALVDELAAVVAGGIVERDARASVVLDRWVRDDDLWLRRAAVLALLLPLRRGEGDLERLDRYADALLDEKELFIRKAVGWVLRDTGRHRPDWVAAWLAPRMGRASGVTLREALKPLSPEQRAALGR